jgi:hypothetical protein
MLDEEVKEESIIKKDIKWEGDELDWYDHDELLQIL